jgi:hypothetical protein
MHTLIIYFEEYYEMQQLSHSKINQHVFFPLREKRNVDIPSLKYLNSYSDYFRILTPNKFEGTKLFFRKEKNKKTNDSKKLETNEKI